MLISKVDVLAEVISDPVKFAEQLSFTKLRRYQQEVIRAVVDSVRNSRGLSFVVMFPRQSGKNEVQAHLEVYLLALCCMRGAEMVKVSPTWKPQSLNAMRRLERILRVNMAVQRSWVKESGTIYRVRRASISFLSAAPESNIVGATASTLLEVDEAQDVLPDKFDREIAPMAASTNATRVFWGTAWTTTTLLARELRAAERAQEKDGIRRVFRLSADEVAAEVPAYARFVAGQIEALGREHPTVKTQLFSEELHGEGGMFHPERRERMRGGHPAESQPLPGERYAFTLDVGGSGPGAGHDASALTILRVDASGLGRADEGGAVFRVAARRMWVGSSYTALLASLRALAETWRPLDIVVDATGIGAGLAEMLARHCAAQVHPFTFNLISKSKLGWAFGSLCDAGGFLDHAEAQGEGGELQALFWRQAEACEFLLRPGGKGTVSWGVPDGTRDPLKGGPLRDDLLVSAVMTAELARLILSPTRPTLVVPAADPLAEMDRGAF